ncbi:MAG: M12 family metallopeptidase [Anaerolineae bacterium]
MKILYSIILSLLLVLFSSLSLLTIANAQEPTDIPEGYKLIEGDILVPVNSYEADGIGIRSAYTSTSLWPNGIVPYEFSTTVTMVSQTLMLAAMQEWENVATVDFKAHNSEADFVYIQNSSENSSPIGIQGGKQVINIFNWNNRFVMAHELAHTLGFWHEQSRPDRDSYVTIITGNIIVTDVHNFATHAEADVYPKAAYGLSGDKTYDFDSVMHYSQCAFSIATCPPAVTIQVQPAYSTWQNKIGQRTHLSPIDKLTMSFLYPKNNWYFVDGTHSGLHTGDFLSPYPQFTTAMNSVTGGDILWIQPGNYSAVGIYNQAVTLQAPLGNVTLGP